MASSQGCWTKNSKQKKSKKNSSSPVNCSSNFCSKTAHEKSDLMHFKMSFVTRFNTVDNHLFFSSFMMWLFNTGCAHHGFSYVIKCMKWNVDLKHSHAHLRIWHTTGWLQTLSAKFIISSDYDPVVDFLAGWWTAHSLRLSLLHCGGWRLSAPLWT